MRNSKYWKTMQLIILFTFHTKITIEEHLSKELLLQMSAGRPIFILYSLANRKYKMPLYICTHKSILTMLLFYNSKDKVAEVLIILVPYFILCNKKQHVIQDFNDVFDSSNPLWIKKVQYLNKMTSLSKLYDKTRWWQVQDNILRKRSSVLYYFLNTYPQLCYSWQLRAVMSLFSLYNCLIRCEPWNPSSEIPFNIPGSRTPSS